jgi:hypothetical protein
MNVAAGLIGLTDQKTINATIEALMGNIDAEYEALCAEYALTSV